MCLSGFEKALYPGKSLVLKKFSFQKIEKPLVLYNKPVKEFIFLSFRQRFRSGEVHFLIVRFDNLEQIATTHSSLVLARAKYLEYLAHPERTKPEEKVSETVPIVGS
jgi:hypothetical protein